MKDLRVAVVCLQTVPGRPEENLKRIHDRVLEASSEGADLVCFPELCVTGYLLEHPLRAWEEMQAEAAVDSLTRMAQEAHLIILAGYIEPCGNGLPFISHGVAGPSGVLGTYRKTHLSPPETGVYCPGEEIKVFTWQGTCFGIELCYEAHFPEISTLLALMGAEILFVPHASPRGSPDEKLQSWHRHLRARAFDNSMFVVACNPVGMGPGGLFFPGVALVIGPDGQVLKSYSGAEEIMLMVDLDADLLSKQRGRRMSYFLPRRRPELYGRILQGATI